MFRLNKHKEREKRKVESKLKQLFDFQRFYNNDSLARMIAETESRYSKELNDDDLSFVSAAGEESSGWHRKDGGHGDE